MGIIIVLLVGALIGWLASVIMHTDQDMGAIANIVVGIVGAWLGKWIFADLLGIGGAVNAGDFSIMGIFWGVLGAVILIWIIKMVYRTMNMSRVK